MERARSHPTPSYWIEPDLASSMTQAGVLAGINRNAKRVLVVGTGPEADHLHGLKVTELGAESVGRFTSSWDSLGVQLAANEFRADCILGVRGKPPLPPAGRRDPPKRRKSDDQTPDFPPPDHRGYLPVPSDDYLRRRGTPAAPPMRTPDIGGVLLYDTAVVAGDGDVGPHLTSGGFSLVLENEYGEMDLEVLRKFVTVLWAVYYGKEAPGVSIDPIAPGVDKHLVRYIGKVVNTDLGRVMREADYQMKKWAVGTEQADVPGFMNVDDLTAAHGFRFLGAGRRFWFVPEEMRFRRSGDVLVFVSGRMTLKTEYVLQNKSVRAEPADEAFAAFFTRHYDEIAERYPVYRELFTYARLVSIARYLKEKGVPLQAFLMANKDLVLTEDSPGTVDELVRGSGHFAGVSIHGGVDLGGGGRYVFDDKAVCAVAQAWSRRPREMRDAGRPGNARADEPPAAAVPLDFADRRYSVLQQQGGTSVVDRRGIEYRTDVAVRDGSEPGLELVRYRDPARSGDMGEFGKGWRLFIPYRVAPADTRTRRFLNVVIPEKMVLHHLVTGDREVLSFSTDRYAIAGYVPDRLESSQVIGLFVMSDGSFRLADKLGNEFRFDAAGHLTDTSLASGRRVHLEYARGFMKTFERAPCRLVPAGPERQSFLNVLVPARMKVRDLEDGSEEVLVFSSKRSAAGYEPENPTVSRFSFLALMTDGSFRLIDRKGNE
ncbi:MAG TPA: hypothetical protein VMX57_04880, partial [Planctomycetota bacterium]|nr:hypothetical protein [Planctomycetota bacterium]